MAADLSDRIREELDRREQIAQAAAAGGTWRYAPGDSIGAWTLYDETWNIASLTTYATETFDYTNRLPAYRNPSYIDPDAIGRHMETSDPADALRRYAAARRVLERHKPVPWSNGNGYDCTGCGWDRESEDWREQWPCAEVLDCADGLGIEVSP